MRRPAGRALFGEALRGFLARLLAILIAAPPQAMAAGPGGAAAEAHTGGRPEAALPGAVQPPSSTCTGDAKARILFVVGVGVLRPADQAVTSRLGALGNAVTVKADSEARVAEAAGYDLVLLSSSARAVAVDPAFRDVAVPIVTWHPALHVPLALSRTAGRVLGPSDRLKMLDGDHPLAANLWAEPFVATATTALSGGYPEPAAIRIARLPGSSRETALFAYERDALMAGMTAPARRVALFLNGETAAHLNTDGWRLFDAAVNWALSSEALFVAGPPSLNKGDLALATFLERLGYALTIRMDERVRETDALGKRFVFISETVRRSTLRGRLREVAVPVIASQPALFADLGLTGPVEGVDFGTKAGQTTVTISDEWSPLAAGLRGDVDVLLEPFGAGWGRPSGEGQTIAELHGNAGKAALFAYERGAQMAGELAPERRVGLFLLRDAPDRLSSDGWSLLRAAVAWSAHEDRDASCTRPLDVMLVLDRSASMRGSRLRDAKTAAERFVHSLHLDRDRVGLVSFADDARVDQALTGDGEAVVEAIEGLQAGGGTDIPGALELANQAVTAGEGSGAGTPVIVLLTDGRSGCGHPHGAVPRTGTGDPRVITIGLGTQVDEAELRQLASSPVDFYLAPSSADLGWIELLIAATLCARENEPPLVDAGADQTIVLPVSDLVLDPTVTDDGRPACGALTVLWEAVSGPGPVSFADPTAPATTAHFAAPGEYVLRLTASDGERSASDEIAVHVSSGNTAPVVNAGPDLTLVWPAATATLVGTVTDDGRPAPVTSLWTVVTPACLGHVSFANPASLVTTATLDAPGVCTLRLSASDSELEGRDEMVLASGQPNRPPTVAAGPPQTITMPVDTVTLSGTVVDDGLPMPPGVVSVLWTGAPEVIFANPAALSTTATFSQPGSYTLTLTASDSQLVASATTTVTVRPANQPPTVDAGPAQRITLPTNQTTLSGIASDDGLPDPPAELMLSWTQLSGPSAVSFEDPTSATTEAAFDGPGIYVLRLSASDGQLTSTSDVTVTVSTQNQAPLVSAGPNRAVNLPANGGPVAVSLTGAATDDGLPNPPAAVTARWSLLSGPSSATIEDPAQLTTTASFDSEGTYVLRLAASDSELSAAETVSITVNPPGPENQPPVLEAGPNLTITLPSDTVMLNGTSTDDGLPAPPGALTVSWQQVGGPSGVSFEHPASAATHATFPGVGSYVLQLQATDGELSSSTRVIVTVNPVGFGNQAPTVSAGADQTVLFPASTATLNGVATDDGLPVGVLSVRWSVVETPPGASVVLADPGASQTTAAFSALGVYRLRLTASDLQLTASSDVQVTLAASPENQPPIVEAGPSLAVTLPTSSVTLVGSAIDDGLPSPPGRLDTVWTLTSGPGSVTFSDPHSASTTAAFSAAGTYELTLGASDSVFSRTDSTTVTVNEAESSPPIDVNAGPDQTVAVPAVDVPLAGAASEPGVTVTTSWSQVGGPAQAVFADRNAAVTTLTLPAIGAYVLRLTASDGSHTASDEVAITVRSEGGGGLPDLRVQALDASGASIDGQTLRITGMLSAVVVNVGAGDVGGPFATSFFEDRNGDGLFDPDQDNLLGTVTLPGLTAGTAAAATVAVDGTLLFSTSPVRVLVDSVQAVAESDETNNYGSTLAACAPPATTPPFELSLKWAWTQPTVAPESRDVMMTPIVVDLNEDGVPDVVFTSFDGVNSRGMLRAVSGKDGSALFSVTDTNYALDYYITPAAGDIDGDGHLEIVALGDTGRLIAFAHDGTVRWTSGYTERRSQPVIADLDGTGAPSIVVGRQAFTNHGVLRWTGTGGAGLFGYRAMPVVADVDLDGKPEVIAGNTVYTNQGATLWQNTSVPDGLTAVANFDADPYPEIVLVSTGKLWLLDHLGAVKWGPVSLNTDGGGAPLVSDLDGDGIAEIAVAGTTSLMVIDARGQLKWQAATGDYSSRMTAATAFDFFGTGEPAVVYRDELSLWVFRGRDGAVLWKSPVNSYTQLENPVVADVDADGTAEIVTVADTAGGSGQKRGVYVYSHPTSAFVAARRIWNQHSYHVTNVNDDGTIPVHETNSWQTYNNYRQNTLGQGCVFVQPDLAASHLRLAVAGSDLTLTARIGNGGTRQAMAGVPVAFYDGDPSGGGPLLGTTATTSALRPAAFEDVSLTLPAETRTRASVWVVADDTGTGQGLVAELNETNNAYDSGVALQGASGGLPDLAVIGVSAAGLSGNWQTMAVSGQVSAEIRNQSAVAVTAPFTIAFFEDRNRDGLFDEGDTALGSVIQDGLAAGQRVTVSAPASGTLLFRDEVIFAFVDALQEVTESAEDNNVGGSGGSCEYHPPDPSFAPRLKWSWTAGTSGYVSTTPVIADVDRDGVPDVIFTSSTYFASAKLRALSGRDKRPVFTEADGAPLLQRKSGLAVGDLDGSGMLVIGVHESGTRLVAFDTGGVLKWTSPVLESSSSTTGMPAIADLDGDGVAEVIFGRQVLNADGTLRWTGQAGKGNFNSVAADLDLDGRLEVVAGNTAYRADGTILWQNTSISDGYAAVARFGADRYPSVVLVTAGEVTRLDHMGAIQMRVTPPGSYELSPPAIADFAGTGTPQIAVVQAFSVVLIDADGNVRWSSPVVSTYPGPSGVSAFDFDGDKAAELLVGDKNGLKILAGQDGHVLASVALARLTDTATYPVVADVDGNGKTEVVLGSDDYYGGPGLYVYEDANDNWIGARRIWNQHAYHVANVNDDGSIPAHERRDGLVGFRTQARAAGQSGFAAPDFTASFLRKHPGAGHSLALTARIGNGGADVGGSSLPVSFYNGNPRAGGSLLGTAATHSDLPPGEYEDVTLPLDAAPVPRGSIWVAANDRGDGSRALNECNSGNNELDSGVFLNLAPAVSTDGPHAITLPDDTVSLHGTVADDGFPVGGNVVTSWALLSGPGTVSFGNPAAPTTTATFSVPGTYVLQLTANDSQLSGTGNVTVLVNPATTNAPPSVSAGPNQTLAWPTSTLALAGAVSDDGLPSPPALVSSLWTEASGPAPVTFAAANSPSTAVAFTMPGTYVLDLAASDSALVAHSQVTIVVQGDGPVVSAGPSQTITLPASTATLQGSAVSPLGLPLTLLWSRVSGPGNVAFADPASAVTTASFDSGGAYQLRLTASDGSQTASADTWVVLQGSPPQGPPPVAAISSPAEAAVVRSPIEVVGTASSASLFNWTLELRRDGDTGWNRFASGASPVTDTSLATLDPTLLLNGLFEVRLTATDTSLRSTSTSIHVVVRENRKVGQFSVAFTDLEVPVAGLPIRVTRSYDSRDKGQGDFGFGWRLDLSGLRIARNGTTAIGYQATTIPGAVIQYCLAETRPHVVTVTFPDGSVQQFQQALHPSCQAILPIDTVTPGYTAVPGSYGTLVPVQQVGDDYQPLPNGSVMVLASWPGVAELYGMDGQPYDPKTFAYTSLDGRMFIVDTTSGLARLTDTAGNRLSLSPAGVTYVNPAVDGSAKGIDFVRDGSGRITTITDPSGHQLLYTYDADGNLASFTDREENTTTFGYDADFPHYLSTITDPLGRTPIRNTYYPDGRIESHTDAYGKTIRYTHDLAGRQEIVTDRLGNPRVLVYDERGNVTRETDPSGAVVTRTFDERNNLLTETNAAGTTTYTYDALNNRTSVEDSLHNKTLYTYNNLQKPLTTTDARGKVTTNSYDAKGNLLSTLDPVGNLTQYIYDAQGNVLTQTATVGGVTQTTQYEYAAPGYPRRETDASGHATDYTYDGNGNRITQTTSRTLPDGTTESLATTYTYDRNGHLLETHDADGSVTKTTYDAAGRQATTVDKAGRTTKYDYDQMGRLERTTYPDGTSDSTTYDEEGRRKTSTDRAGRVTSFTYDNVGRLLTTTYADGAVLTNEYDGVGRLLRTKDARGKKTEYTYDAAGRRQTVTDATGETTTFGYDANGNQATVLDARGNTTTYVYDDANRRAKTIFPDGSFTLTAYDELGRRVAETDQAGRTTQFGYDALGRLVSVKDASGQTTSYGYDEVGNRLWQKDANGHTTSFTYDPLGRETSRTLPDGSSETKTYDAAGNLGTRTDFMGRTTTYGYDDNNRLTSRSYPDHTGVGFTYTTTGRRETATDARGTTSYTYDLRDRLKQLAYPDGRQLRYGYDLQGNRTSLQAVVGSSTVTTTYDFDDDNRLATVQDALGRPYSLGYDPNGNRAALTQPNGVVTTYTYDALNRLKTLTSQGPLQLVQDYTFTLGPSGNRTRIDEGDGTVKQYSYDTLYRLTGETVIGPAVAYAKAFTYDNVGNRLTQATNGSGGPGSPLAPGSLTYGYDTRDRLLSETGTLAGQPVGITYGFDTNGNLTGKSGEATYTWDFENRLTQVAKADGTAVEYAYDVDGTRVQTITTPAGQPAQVVNYLVDTSGSLSQVVAESGGSGTLTAYYIRGDDLLAVMRPDPGSTAGWLTRFYHADGIGSIRRLTDEAGTITDGYTYSAFGELLAHTGSDPQPYAFTGEPLDPNSGWQYHRARWMDPALGRFVGMDAFEGAEADPPSLHRYLYASASPADRVDPSGLTDYLSLTIAVGVLAIIGAISAVGVNGLSNWVQGTNFLDGAKGAAAFGAAALPLSVAFPALGLVLAGLGIAGASNTAWRVFTSPTASGGQKGGAVFLIGLSLMGAYASANYASGNGLWVNTGFLSTGSLVGTPTGTMSRALQVTADRTGEFSEVLSTMPRPQQNHITMAVGVAMDALGRMRTIVATSEYRGGIRRPMRGLIRPDDIVVRGGGHAEADVVSYCAAQGWRLISIGATRPVCPACAAEIAGAGANAATPLR